MTLEQTLILLLISMSSRTDYDRKKKFQIVDGTFSPQWMCLWFNAQGRPFGERF